MLTLTSGEAQNCFGELLDTAQRETVAITRHGRPAAFLVSPQEMGHLLDARDQRSKALIDLQAWNAKRDKSATRTADALTDEEINRLVHESR